MSVAAVRGAGIAAFAGLILLLSAGCAQTAPSPGSSSQSAASRQPVAAVPVQPAPRPAKPAVNALAALPEAEVAPAAPPEPAVSETFFGNASWYGRKFHGRLTASGERYDMAALT
ncbi:MAG TPA: septal ring lytic transglycosylase RlpA family protein, partial [Kiloniellaceae bacterium]|nr:septal ring lytic transglycosylase RlpA family protein [Kiloniellaceae bacterium]